MVGRIYNVEDSTQSLVDNSFRNVDINIRNGNEMIDEPKYLHNAPVYVAIHTKDKDVSLVQQKAQKEFYQNVGAKVAWYEYPIDHQVSSMRGYGWDEVGNILQHLMTNVPETQMGELKGMVNDWEVKGTLSQFSQAEFLPADYDFTNPITSMQYYGYIYTPNSCKTKSCNLHVSLHSCGYGSLEKWVYPNDYMKYAAANDFIVLFPFHNKCWDVQAQTGPLYATNQGIQPMAIKKMIDKLVKK